MEMFQQYFIDIFRRHYADFNGRARRQEYWMFMLFNLIVSMLLSVSMVVALMVSEVLGILMIVVFMVYAAGLFVPSLALGIRRLHDIGKPGIWWLVNFIPFVGGFIFLYFCILDSQPGSNEFGPNPKES